MAGATAVASSAGPPASGARTDGAPVLAGADVLVPPLVIHRHPDLWDDPERFDTERFTPERETARHRYACSPSTAVHALASASTSRCLSPCSRWRSCCALPGRGGQGDFLDGGDHASGEWDGAGAASGPRSGPLIRKALPCLEGRCQPVERVAGGGGEFSAWLLRALRLPVSRTSHPHPAQPEGVPGGGLRAPLGPSGRETMRAARRVRHGSRPRAVVRPHAQEHEHLRLLAEFAPRSMARNRPRRQKPAAKTQRGPCRSRRPCS